MRRYSFLQDTHPRATTLRPVVYRLCFLHALLLGRRRFGSLGWVRPVDFSFSDLAISLEQLLASVPPDSLQPLPWSLLQHLVSEVNYGGRVTDEWDRQVAVLLKYAIIPLFALLKLLAYGRR